MVTPRTLPSSAGLPPRWGSQSFTCSRSPIRTKSLAASASLQRSGTACARTLSQAFVSADQALGFGRSVAKRVSIASASAPSASNSDKEDSQDRNCIDTSDDDSSIDAQVGITQRETPQNFAQHMLLVCQKVAEEARNEGPNLLLSDSSNSPPKGNRGNKERPVSPPAVRLAGLRGTPRFRYARGPRTVR